MRGPASGKINELCGSHDSTAGLIYRGHPLADDQSLEDLFSHLHGNNSPPRVIVFNDQQPGTTPFRFFPTKEGKTLTIDVRLDPRIAWGYTTRPDDDPVTQTVRHARAMAPELTGYLLRWQGHTTTAEAADDETVIGAAEVEEDEEEEVLIEVNAREVASVPVHRYTNLASDLHLAVVGGVHGNELTGMEGAQCIHEYLSDSANCRLAQAILASATVTVIPCINTVGLAAGARCSPTLHSKVLRSKAPSSSGGGHRVVVGDHQHGSFFPPRAWQDPNRGWVTNRTLVKELLERTLFTPGSAPSMVVWNHDWAIPNGSVIARGAPKELYEMPMRQIFAKHYPSLTGFGKAYEHVITRASDEAEQMDENSAAEEGRARAKDWKYMPDALQALYHHADYTIESYCAGDAVELHFEATLFLLARHSGVSANTEELLAECAEATKRFMAKRRAGKGGTRRRVISPSPLGPT